MDLIKNLSADGSDEFSHYATTSTFEKVYILGGLIKKWYDVSATDTIAVFSYGEWTLFDTMVHRRSGHAAMTNGPLTMILGDSQCDPDTRRLIELWELEDQNAWSVLDQRLSESLSHGRPIADRSCSRFLFKIFAQDFCK